MPLVEPGRYWPRPGDPRSYLGRPGEPSGARSSIIEYPALSELPVPVQALVTAVTLPFDAAVATVRILQNTEALLGEVVLYLRALRPAVDAASRAYADGHFDPVFKTFDQIQQGTSAIGVMWAPITAVRQVVAPGPPRREIPASRSAPVPPPPRATHDAPSLVEWLGGIGGQVLDQAAALPGALFAGSPRRGARPEPEAVGPVTRDVIVAVAGDAAPDRLDHPPPLISWAVRGPIRRLFGD